MVFDPYLCPPARGPDYSPVPYSGRSFTLTAGMADGRQTPIQAPYVYDPKGAPFIRVSLRHTPGTAIVGALRVIVNVSALSFQRQFRTVLYAGTEVVFFVPAGGVSIAFLDLLAGNAGVPATIDWDIVPVPDAPPTELPNLVTSEAGLGNVLVPTLFGTFQGEQPSFSPYATKAEFWARNNGTSTQPAAVVFYATPRELAFVASGAVELGRLVVTPSFSGRVGPIDLRGQLLQELSFLITGLTVASTMELRVIEWVRGF